MSYNAPITRFLGGVSESQLGRLARERILIPEVNASWPRLYSFRDVVAIRAAVKLGKLRYAQPIRQALEKLEPCELVEGLEVRRFARRGRVLLVWYDELFAKAVREPEWWIVVSLAEIYQPFINIAGALVSPLLTPSRGIEISPLRQGGKPTIAGTQVHYEALLDLDRGGVTQERMFAIHPVLSTQDVANAKAFHEAVYGRRSDGDQGAPAKTA